MLAFAGFGRSAGSEIGQRMIFAENTGLAVCWKPLVPFRRIP